MESLVEGEFAGLTECPRAAFLRALERLLPGVDVGVLLQVLAQRELLVADHADELLCRGMCVDVSAEGEACGEGLIALRVVAFVWSSHW